MPARSMSAMGVSQQLVAAATPSSARASCGHRAVVANPTVNFSSVGALAVRDQRAVRSGQAVDATVENQGPTWGWSGGADGDNVWEHKM
jgi:hypothetical protein